MVFLCKWIILPIIKQGPEIFQCLNCYLSSFISKKLGKKRAQAMLLIIKDWNLHFIGVLSGPQFNDFLSWKLLFRSQSDLTNMTLLKNTVNVSLIYFMPLISFYNPWKHQHTSSSLMYSGNIEKDQWNETS